MLGCGYGHDALLFARAGHQVTGFDFAPSAILGATASARAARLDVRFEQADIFTLGHRYRSAFDLVVEHACFCAIHPRQRGEYVSLVRELLAAGGQLVAILFAHGRWGGPPYSTSQHEVEQLFRPAFDILRLEVARDSIPRRAGQELFALMRTRT